MVFCTGSWNICEQFAMPLTLFVLLCCLMTIYMEILFHRTLTLFRNVGIWTLLLSFDRPHSISHWKSIAKIFEPANLQSGFYNNKQIAFHKFFSQYTSILTVPYKTKCLRIYLDAEICWWTGDGLKDMLKVKYISKYFSE